MNSARARHLAALLLVAALALEAHAADLASAAQQTTLMLRILAFDRKLASRASGTLTVAVVFREGNEKSETMANEMVAQLNDSTRKATVGGLPVKAVKLAHGPKFDAELKDSGARAAFLCNGLDDSIGAISRATQAQGALSFTHSEEYLRAGASVALVTRDTKLGIVVHLPNMRSEGAEIDSSLLRLAEIIR